MRNKALCLLLLLCACAALAGCRFAAEQPSTQPAMYVGVSLKLENWGAPAGYDEDGTPYYEPEPQEMQPELTGAQTRAILQGEPLSLDEALPLGERWFCIRTWTDEDGNESAGMEQHGWPGEVRHHMTVSDTEEKYESDAQVYITGALFRGDSDDRFVMLHLDDIYQRPDGTVYASRRHGGVGGHIGGFSREITSSESQTGADGVTKTVSVRCKVSIQYVNELETALVCAFDERGALLSRTALDWQGALDAQTALTYAVPQDAAYLILEETGVTMTGARQTLRTLANLPAQDGAALFTLRAPDGTGFALPLDVTGQ